MKQYLTRQWSIMTAAILAFLAGCGELINKKLFEYQARNGMVLGAATLTGLIPDAFQAMDTVVREMTGFIPAVTLNASAARAALNQSVTTHVAPALAAVDTTPAAYPADAADFTMGTKKLLINKSKIVPFHWQGEEQVGVNFGTGYAAMRQDQIAQALRTLVNLIETDLGILTRKASRAYGTANTTPFGSDLSESANALKILKDNGAPGGDLQMVISTSAGAKVRTLANLVKANEAGTTALREQGILLPIHGMTLRESAAVTSPNALGNTTAGNMASATTTAVAKPVGSTVIPLATAGTGKVYAGDVITLAGDTNKYVVTSTSFAGSNPAAGDTITIANPGLRVDAGSSAVAITVIATSCKNLAFHRSAIHLALRTPALPEEGDMADDRMVLTDPRTGISVEFAMYKQYRRVRYELGAAWGAEVIKPEFTAALLGEA
jgi:hypothetical protein